MKRDSNLVPFSHDHHHGLVFCRRLKKSRNADRRTIERFVSEFWEVHLKRHFEEEERVLSDWKDQIPAIHRMLEEHQWMVAHISLAEVGDEAFYDHVDRLAEYIERHIRFEEKELFEDLQNSLSHEVLSKIGRVLESREGKGHDFQPQFWLNQ